MEYTGKVASHESLGREVPHPRAYPRLQEDIVMFATNLLPGRSVGAR